MVTVLLAFCSIQGFGQSHFIENKGQWNAEVTYLAEMNGTAIFLTSDGYSILQYDKQKWGEWMSHHGKEEGALKKWIDRKQDMTLHFHHYKVHFEGAQKNFTIESEEQLPFKLNYFLGNDPSRHASNVRAFKKVWYRGIYPGVDVEFLLGPNGFKYNLHLYPGANADNIRMLVEGADKVVLEQNIITVHTSLENVVEAIPVAIAYLQEDDVPIEKSVRFKLNENVIGFTSDDWNASEYVVIDPVVVFSTYSGSSADNFGFTATYDEEGNLYAGGITTGPTFSETERYPATVGAYDVKYNGGDYTGDYIFPCDITISKYSSDGTTLIYATYIGGEHNEYPHSLIVNQQGELIIFGTTFSTTYPVTANAFQDSKKGGSDIIVSKLSADGSALIGSTYVGGERDDGLNQIYPLSYFYADDFRGEVNVDENGDVFVASCTYSTDFPVTPGCFQETLKGQKEGIVMRLNASLSKMVWATYLGGSAGDALYSVDFDRNGDVFVSGGTESRNFPGTENGKYPQYFGGRSDGIICALSHDGTKLKRATYWGTGSVDQVISLEIDDANKIYVVGQSEGKMPVIGSVYRNANSGQFVTRFSNDLKEVEFSTVIGSGDGMPDITINAFLVDQCRKIFISGWGGENSTRGFSSTYNLPVTNDAAQRNTDGSDFYLMVLSKDAKDLLYATYFGGNRSADHVDGGTSRFDKKGVIYQSVCASCQDASTISLSDFPTTSGSFSPKNFSPRCSNAAFKIAFGNLNRAPNPDEIVITVRAFEELSFDYSIIDLDGDTMDITFIPADNLADNMIDFDSTVSVIGQLNRTLRLKPDCEDVTGDTVSIRVNVTDRGCPAPKDSIGYIKVVVLPPPLIDPPETVCLLFLENGLEINWTGIVDSAFFDAVLLYKIFPDGREEIVKTTFSRDGGMFVDTDVTDPRKNNYGYYLRVRNVCGDLGDPSFIISSVKESEVPIEVTTVLTATVVENKHVLVKWLHSREEDFGLYDVYRYEKFNNKEEHKYIGSTFNVSDTFFIDEDVDVQTTSYCYVVVVKDRCGHQSLNSNRGCTIVLDGSSKPFAFDLWWNSYDRWELGVQEYTVLRSVDTGILRTYDKVGEQILNYHDDTLNYDWGGYWYEILALERSGYNETSRSNRIYLIQPPLLHVPNAFTPNKDNLNEKWGIVPVFVKTYHLQVYNRWGERVYESTEKKVLWDGFYKEEQMANNVYIYTITYTGWDHSVHHTNGTVTVVK